MYMVNIDSTILFFFYVRFGFWEKYDVRAGPNQCSKYLF